MNRRFRRGVGAQGFGQAVQVFVRVTEVPLLLAAWGTQRYGEWLILAAVPACLVMADAGFTGTTSREMAMRASAGDRQGAAALFQSAWGLLLVISAGVAALGAAAAWLLPWSDWLGLSAISGREAAVVLSLLVLHALASLQCNLLNGPFWCEGRYAGAMYLTGWSQLLEFAGLAAAVAWGGGPAAAASGYLAGRVAGWLWTRARLGRAWPYGLRAASRAALRPLVSPSLASLAFPLGNALNIQGMRIVVGLALGPAAVAAFSPIRTLSRVAMQCTAMIARLLEPEVALAFGAGDPRALRSMLRRSSQAALWLGGAVCLALLAGGERLLALWTHGQIAMDATLFALLLAAALGYALWAPALMVPYATNRHQRMAVFYSLVYGAAALALGFAGATILGLAGVGLALVAAEIAVAAYVVPAVLRMSGEPWKGWVRALVAPPWREVR